MIRSRSSSIPLVLVFCLELLVIHPSDAFIQPKYNHQRNFVDVNPRNPKRKDVILHQSQNYAETIRSSILSVLLSSTILLSPHEVSAAPTTVLAPTNPEEGVQLITGSDLGRAVRKSTIQGARIIDNIDEKWERFSDSLRDKNKCDEATGRKLFDNGFRKDGTRIGNPVLGALCNPVELEVLNQDMGDRVLEYALKSAAVTTAGSKTNTGASTDMNMDMDRLKQSVQKVETLVRPSFERSINDTNENEQNRKLFNFAMYSNLRAINDELTSSVDITKFYLNWGESLISYLAPNANKNDYSSPFPEVTDEFEDYDYDKENLLDSLGILNVALKNLQKQGLIGYYEISIPYDDYGSVVTLAVDDDITLGSQLLLREQGMKMSGSFVESLVRAVMNKANLKYSLDSFFIDPSTTKQDVYNPSQLLLSLSNLRMKD